MMSQCCEKSTMDTNIKDLQLFLFLLMRDHLPSGVIVDMVENVENCKHTSIDYIGDANCLATYAEKLAKRILIT